MEMSGHARVRTAQTFRNGGRFTLISGLAFAAALALSAGGQATRAGTPSL